MFRFKKKKDKVDYEKINAVLSLLDKFLKLIFIVVILFILTYLVKEWGLIKKISTVLSVLTPLLIGVILAWLFDPFVSALQKKGIKRLLGSSLVYVIFLAILTMLVSFVAPILYAQINDIINKSPAIIGELSSRFDTLVLNLAETYDLNFDQLKLQAYATISSSMNSFTVELPSLIISFIKSLINGSVKFIFGLFIGFYMLLDFDGMKKQFKKIVPKKQEKEYSKLFISLDSILKNYVQGTLFVIIILFICQTVGFTLAGLEAPLVFGLICAITNVIPYVGPYIGGIPAVLVGFTLSPTIGFFTLIAVVVCQLLESYLLTPAIMSKTMKLHPVVIIVGLLIFGHFFGIIGMLFATPIISAIKIIFNFFFEKYYVNTKGETA